MGRLDSSHIPIPPGEMTEPNRRNGFMEDGIIFSGNAHDSVPRALLLDKRLTPLERNAWQVFRLKLNEDGITALPTYDQLAPWLASMPCTQRASHETVARALVVLRLTRWLSLVRRRREQRTGRIQGNLYVLHDEPLSPYEAIRLDADYLELISQSLIHTSKSIQRVAAFTLKELSEDPLLCNNMLPGRLHLMIQRMQDRGWDDRATYPQPVDNHDSEDGDPTFLRNRDTPSSDSEVGNKSSKTSTLRDPKTDSTVSKEKKIKEIRTVPRTHEQLTIPVRFESLSAEQQNGALTALQAVENTLQQAVLDEWDARCGSTIVRNPAGYLFGIIQKAMRGEFHIWAGQQIQPDTRPSVPHSPATADPEIARQHIARLRELLNSS
ncbi:STY4528 family pathogenicity island replication protein [Serratia sp. 1D1416]